MVHLSITIDDNEGLEALADEIKDRCSCEVTREEVITLLPEYFHFIAVDLIERGLENGLRSLNVTAFEKIMRKIRREEMKNGI